MLCDITIYYSYLKMLYSYWMQPLPLRHVYGSVCPLFGVWHPYKYCVDHTYNAFVPFMVALEYEGFLQNPAARQLYAYPPFIVKERLILAIYLSIPGIHVHLHSNARSRTLKDKLLAGLYRLVFHYAPALLRLGIMVCDGSCYHHTPGTGDAAKRCLQVSLYLIQKLCPQHKDGGCKRALHLALRMWSPYPSSLPASAFVEEKGEALLSRLARAVGEDTSITSVDDYHNVFVTLRHQQPGVRKPLTSPHITRESP